MQSTDYNLELVEAMLEEIEDFILSADIFWPLAKSPKSGPATFPRLSIGGLLLTQDETRAQEAEMSTGQKVQLSKLQQRWEATLDKWRSGIQRKSEREMGMRLNLWRAYLSDLEEGNASRFDFEREAHNRVLFARLKTLTPDNEEIHQMVDAIHSLDAQLLNLTAPSEFIWDERLQVIYPADEYGYLRRQPRESSM